MKIRSTISPLILTVFLLTAWNAFGQPYTSRLGRFEVDQKKGCAPFTITLTNLLVGDCTPGKPCVMDYEGKGNTAQNQFTFTYTTPGTYKLSVLYQSIGSDDITVTVVANTQPNFEIHACSGNRASLQAIDSNYDQYVFDFNNDGTPEYILPYSNSIITPAYTYSPSGTYTAAVRGRNLNSADNCTPKTQVFNTLASLPAPTINTLTSIDNTSLKLDFAISPNIQYKLEISVNGAAFQQYQTFFGVTTFTSTSLKLDLNYYCFRLGAYDVCNNVNTYSNVVCSDVFNVSATSDVNHLNWTTGNTGAVLNYSITRNGSSYVTQGAQFLDDTDVICKTNYCYQVTTNYVGGSRSVSLSKCVNTFSNKIPTVISDVSSVVVRTGGVDLSWTQDPAFTPVNYVIQRSSNKSPFSFLTTAPAVKFTDNSYTTEGKYCYRINYTDKCDNIAPQGITTCPVQLTGTLTNSNAISLVWSSYRGWKNGVKNYTLEKYNLQGALIKSVTQTDTTFLDDAPDPNNQFVQYIVKANPNDIAPPLSVSNQVEFIKDSHLYYPTAFTPNNDNLNDGFIVSGQFIVKMSLKIFDRWGVLQFATEKNEPWNGLRDGKAMPASTYVWKVDITDLAGQVYSREGTVALILN